MNSEEARNILIEHSMKAISKVLGDDQPMKKTFVYEPLLPSGWAELYREANGPEEKSQEDNLLDDFDYYDEKILDLNGSYEEFCNKRKVY